MSSGVRLLDVQLEWWQTGSVSAGVMGMQHFYQTCYMYIPLCNAKFDIFVTFYIFPVIFSLIWLGYFWNNSWVIIPPQGYVRIILPVCSPVCFSVQMSCKRFSFTDELILIKLYTVTVYDLRMCMKEDNPSLKYFKGDSCGGRSSFLSLWHQLKKDLCPV